MERGMGGRALRLPDLAALAPSDIPVSSYTQTGSVSFQQSSHPGSLVEPLIAWSLQQHLSKAALLSDSHCA